MKAQKEATKKRNWETFRTEFVTGDIVTLSKYFKGKKIPRGTWSHHTKGWVPEREKYQRDVGDEIKAEVKKAKVLTASKQAEYLSSVVAGVLNRWKIMNNNLTKWESELLAKPTQKELNRIGKNFNEVTRMLPELMKTLELLAGRADSRPEVHDKTKKEIEQLQKQYDEKRNRIDKMAKRGPIKVVKKKAIAG